MKLNEVNKQGEHVHTEKKKLKYLKEYLSNRCFQQTRAPWTLF
jgi:hypothetical protein